MTLLKRMGYVLLGLVALWLLIALWPLPQQVEGRNVFRSDDGLPLIIAHRGGYHEFPESTMEAYCNAYNVHNDVVFEADVVLTSDKVLIINHDRTLDRNTDLPPGQDAHLVSYQSLLDNRVNFAYNNALDRSDGYRVGDLRPYTTYQGESVTPLDAQCPSHIEGRDEELFLVTTIEELIRAFPNQRITVEIKNSGDLGREALAIFVDLLDEIDAEDTNQSIYDRVSLGTFHREIYDAFVELKNSTHPNLLFSPQEDVVYQYFILHHLRLTQFFRAPIAALQVPRSGGGFNLDRRHFVRTAQRHNIAVHYWTINDPDVMRDLIELGVDGIITDRVTQLKTILDEFQD